MSDTKVIPPAPTYTMQRHHIHWGALALVLVLGGIGVGGFYAGGGNAKAVDGHLVITKPNLDTLTGRVQIRTQDGQVVEGQLQQQAQPVPNGQTEVVTDDFDPNHQLQRTEIKTNRYGPIDQLTAAVTALKDTAVATNRSVETLTGNVQMLSGRVDALGTTIADVKTRLGAVEAKQATPAPAPAPPVPAVVAPAPTSEIVPEKAPVQAAEGAPTPNFDRSGLPANWHIDHVNGQAKAEKCLPPHTLRVSTDPSKFTRLPRGGVRRPLVCD